MEGPPNKKVGENLLGWATIWAHDFMRNRRTMAVTKCKLFKINEK
jgi:hypothetical protein